MATPSWRLLNTDYAHGDFNMALDEAIMQLHGQGKAPPTLRFYGWNPPCLSIGYFQSLKKDVDFNKCSELGIDCVRRLSGGRAILHDEELTYSLVASEEDGPMSGGIRGSCLKISAAIAQGLRSLGIKAEVGQTSWQQPLSASPLCFQTPFGHEITVDGRKVAGSAQVRKRGVILQQGSILLGIDVERLFRVLKMPDDDSRCRLKTSFRQHAVPLKELLMREVNREEVAEAVARSFERAFHIRLIEGELSKEEKVLAQRLIHERYGKREWTLRR